MSPAADDHPARSEAEESCAWRWPANAVSEIQAEAASTDIVWRTIKRAK